MTQALLEPAAVLAMLGFKARELHRPELQTRDAQAQAQAVPSLTQTHAGVSSVSAAEAANTGTAAAAVVTEASEAGAGHPLTLDQDVGANEPQPTGQKDCGGSLLALLGLGGVTEGSARGANRAEVCEEEDARQIGRQACIALHVVEALLDAALTKPEASAFYSQPPCPAVLSTLLIPSAQPPPPPPLPTHPQTLALSRATNALAKQFPMPSAKGKLLLKLLHCP